MRRTLVLGGVEVDVPFPVRRDPKWYGKLARRKRTKPIQFGVIHHQGGEGSANTLWRVLRKRGYSVHFGIDKAGVITQYEDPCSYVTLHAGPANGMSYGIEIANRGLAPAHKRVPRVSYMDDVHGREINFLRFRAPQVFACYQLTAWLNAYLGLPMDIPQAEDGRALREVFPGWRDWHGLLAHFHVNRRKIDPVPHLLDALISSSSKSRPQCGHQ